MAKGGETAGLVASVAKLALDAEKTTSTGVSKPSAKPKMTKKKKEVADSWEDEDVSSEEETPPAAPKTAPSPTPTPVPVPAPTKQAYRSTPSAGGNPLSSALSADWSRPDPSASDSGPARRPEKTDVVARRLIAGALGIRVPQTAEQKAYNKSLLETERKKREKARAEKKQQEEEAERAKKAVWGE